MALLTYIGGFGFCGPTHGTFAYPHICTQSHAGVSGLTHCLYPGRVVSMCKYFQESVKELSLDYYNTLRRYNYVTPTSYLELILTFKTLLNSKRQEVDMIRSRYLTGLQKLEFAASQVRMTTTEQGQRPRVVGAEGLVQVLPCLASPPCRVSSQPPPMLSTLSCLYSRFQ